MSTLSPHFRLDNPREREKETIRETAERSDAEAAFFREHPYMGGFAFLQLTKEVAILSPSRQVSPNYSKLTTINGQSSPRTDFARTERDVMPSWTVMPRHLALSRCMLSCLRHNV